jgi:anti-sigma factor RsiW
MTIDPETLMAYADGELDPLAAKRVERAIAADPMLADEVAQHRALRERLSAGFAPIAAAPVPDRLTSLLNQNVVPMPTPVPARPRSRWQAASALAACLLVGVFVGHQWQDGGPVAERNGRLYAGGDLSRALDTQLASAAGEVRVPVSFRERSGAYCRVFTSSATDGIACRDGSGWALRQTRAGGRDAGTDYRQAGSGDAALMAEAQAMMAGEPLDADAEAKAREDGWR